MRWFRVARCVLFGCVFVHSAQAQEIARESMRGLRGVGVHAYTQDRSGKFMQYIDVDQLRTRMELRLRQANVRVFSDSEMVADVHAPSVDLLVWGLPEDDDGNAFAIHMRLALNQRVWLAQPSGP